MQGCPLEAMIEQSPDIIARLDRTSRHLYVNSSIRLIGVEPAYARGKTWRELGLSPEVSQQWLQKLAQVFRSGEQLAFDTRVPVTDKDPLYLHMSFQPELTKDGTVETVLWVGRDITNLTLLVQRNIEQARQMEEEIARLSGLNLVGRLAAVIGHEIRNPMTTIRGFLQLLNNQETDVKRQEFFRIMIEELDRAGTIISEYLSLAKNKPTELKEGSLNAIIEGLHPLLQGAAFQCDKNILCVLGKDEPVMLAEDEIRQLILNLVKNGLEATPIHSCVTLKTRKEDDWLLLQIQDEGCGIPPHVLEKIGTPFFTTKENGTGLGLTVCYSIAKRHQASIDIKSGAAGTTFYVRFPIRKKRRGERKRIH